MYVLRIRKDDGFLYYNGSVKGRLYPLLYAHTFETFSDAWRIAMKSSTLWQIWQIVNLTRAKEEDDLSSEHLSKLNSVGNRVSL
jgi:hypothetical protein